MSELFEGQTVLFTIPAILGGLVFLLRMALMMIGGIADIDGDIDVDVDADIDAVHADSTEAFRALSIQTISAFLMGFGCGGLTAKLGLAWDFGYSVIAAIVFAAFMVWLITVGMRFVYDLQSSGNVNIKDAMGGEAVVYTQIPAQGQGRGRVRVVINERLRTYNAITEGDAIASQTRVRVTRVNGDNSLTVAAI